MLSAAQESGIVRAADQVIPGAAVTASQGTAKIIAYTDENGRYSMNLPSGSWELHVEVLGFITSTRQVTIGDQPDFQNWTLEMPRIGAPASAEPDQATAPSMPANTNGRGRGRFGGRGGDRAASDAEPGAGGIGQGPGGPGRGGAGR